MIIFAQNSKMSMLEPKFFIYNGFKDYITLCFLVKKLKDHIVG
jgi:hypothetical protein